MKSFLDWKVNTPMSRMGLSETGSCPPPASFSVSLLIMRKYGKRWYSRNRERHLVMRKRLMRWTTLDRNSMRPILIDHLRMGYKLLRDLLSCFRPPVHAVHSRSVQTFYLELCWSTTGRKYSHKSSWVWCYKISTPKHACLENLSSSVRLDWELWWTCSFRVKSRR